MTIAASTRVVWRTNPHTSCVHLVVAGRRLELGELDLTVCGRRLVTVPDEGGYPCFACGSIARTDGLTIPRRARG